jgi:hypothetical protein
MTRQRAREIAVFTVLFALPFAGAFAVEPWAAFLLCPLGVVGLLGLNESLGDLRTPGRPPAPHAVARGREPR